MIPATIYSSIPGCLLHFVFALHYKYFENLFFVVVLHVHELAPFWHVSEVVVIPAQQIPLIGSTFPSSGPTEQKS